MHNLRANPRARVEIGSQSGIETVDVIAHELPRAERDRLFDRVVAAAPGFGEYESKTSRIIPLFELKRV